MLNQLLILNIFCIFTKFCGSTNTVCDGYNYYKVKRQRYLCKECKKHFTAPINSNVNSGEGELLEA